MLMALMGTSRRSLLTHVRVVSTRWARLGASQPFGFRRLRNRGWR